MVILCVFVIVCFRFVGCEVGGDVFVVVVFLFVGVWLDFLEFGRFWDFEDWLIVVFDCEFLNWVCWDLFVCWVVEEVEVDEIGLGLDVWGMKCFLNMFLLDNFVGLVRGLGLVSDEFVFGRFFVLINCVWVRSLSMCWVLRLFVIFVWVLVSLVCIEFEDYFLWFFIYLMDCFKMFFWLCRNFLDWWVKENECNDLVGKCERFFVKLGDDGFLFIGKELVWVSIVFMEVECDRVMIEGLCDEELEFGNVGVFDGGWCCWIWWRLDRLSLCLWLVMRGDLG